MNDKEKKKNGVLKRLYGITLDDYNKMLEKQNHCCAICGKHESNFKRSLNVDHDHRTGEVRGLLCYYCNRRFVGRHTKESVIKLVKYLLPEYELVKRDLTKQTSSSNIKRKRKR